MVTVVSLSWMNTISEAVNQADNLEQILELAQENENKAVYKIAINKYKEAISIDPETIEYYHKIIDLSAKSERYDILESYSLKAIDLFPTDGKAYMDLCQYYMIQDNYKATVNIALKANQNLEDASEFETIYYEMAYRYKVLASEYQEAKHFIGSYAPIKKDDYWGLIGEDGKYLIPPMYDSISVLSSDKIAVDDGSSVYYIDKDNDKVLASTESIDKAYPFISGLAVVEKDKTYGYINSKFKIFDMKWSFATNYMNGIAAVKKDEKWALRDFEKNMISDFIYDDIIYDENLICSNAGVIFAKENNLYYLLNLNGEKIIDTGFVDAKPFTKDGIAPVKVGSYWGFIDQNGHKIVDPKYDDAHAFGYGVAPVKKDGKWFYINKKERVVIEGDFQECLSFSANGLAPVKVDNHWTYIKILLSK